MKFAKLAALAVAMAYGTSQAAVITFQTGFFDAGVQSSAEAYRSIVDAAVANSSHSTVLSNYDIVSNQSLFGNGGAFQSFSANTCSWPPCRSRKPTP